ncbi:MAG: sigma-70 family RNA polymerase sigma factor [Planctomycetota bacterium]
MTDKDHTDRENPGSPDSGGFGGTPQPNAGLGGHEAFVLQIVEHQQRLYAYICSLVLNRDRARDLLQQLNVVLLEKEADFEAGTNFGAWSSKVAFYEVLAYRRRQGRDRHLFSEELLSMIADEAEDVTSDLEDRLAALRDCLDKLDEPQRQLVESRYGPGGSVKEIAKLSQKTPGAISAELFRIRNALADCIGRRLGGALT